MYSRNRCTSSSVGIYGSLRISCGKVVLIRKSGLNVNAYAGEFRFFTAPNLYADLAFSETFPALAYTVENFGTERLLFGSHAPFFCLHSELSKLDWPQLSPEQISNISSKNIERLLYGK